MSDTHCFVCNEPWDIYGLTHGDVKAWEADAIKKGYGCPCCKSNGIEPSELYDKYLKYIQLKICDDCNNSFNLNTDELHYDGSQKAMYHNSGTIHINDEEEVARFLIIEYDWKQIYDKLVCKSCGEHYSQCEFCDGIFDEDDTIWINDDQIVCCQDCYVEVYGRCKECDCTVAYEDLKSIENADYCEFCYRKLVVVCEICEEEFLEENKIEGINGEICCSEQCADKTTEEEEDHDQT